MSRPDFLPVFGLGHTGIVIMHVQKIYQGLPDLLGTTVFATGVGPAHVYYLIADPYLVNTGQSYPFGFWISVVSDLILVYGVEIFYLVPLNVGHS